MCLDLDSCFFDELNWDWCEDKDRDKIWLVVDDLCEWFMCKLILDWRWFVCCMCDRFVWFVCDIVYCGKFVLNWDWWFWFDFVFIGRNGCLFFLFC